MTRKLHLPSFQLTKCAPYNLWVSKVLSLVGLLRENKVTSGDRIAYLAKNSSEFIELMYASSILELVMVPINFRLAYEEVKFIIQDSGAKIIIFGEEFKELVEKLNADKTDLHLSFGKKLNNYTCLSI